ncbi:MAG: hypothetical protein LQ352_006667 [Teloschistes flavicans]|nr:MAG: hypothetical protein LQ352_006667 [Teloschistes flavicans]
MDRSSSALIDRNDNNTPSSLAAFSFTHSTEGDHHETTHPRSPNPSDDMDYSSPIPLSRTRVSSTASTPLRHPTPDLQSLQGAYLSNVERLEQSAERLSMSGSDIGEELRKIRMEQKISESRRSSLMNARAGGESSPSNSRQFSYSNSIAGINSIARSGGFSPEAYFASPQASMRSSIRSGPSSRRNSIKARSASNASRLAHMLDPRDEVTSPTNIATGFIPLSPPPEPPGKVLRVMNSTPLPAIDAGESLTANSLLRASPEPTPETVPRPSSTDTFQQAQAVGLFADFDGVHAHTIEHAAASQSASEQPQPRQASSRMSSAGRPQSYLEPIPGEDMVYYPAPVPMMLNLPQKLSKNPTDTRREKRRSEMLAGLGTNARQSAAWLPNVAEGEDDRLPEEKGLLQNKDRRKTVGELPPQLRASLFFDYPATQQDVEMKGGSAVETLDSILDASAFAPVSAFTDHPIAGRVGKEVYGRAVPDRRSSYMPLAEPRARKRRSSLNLLKKRNSKSDLLEEPQRRNSSLLSLGFGRRKSSAPQPEQDAEDQGALAGPLPSEVTPLRNGEEYAEAAGDEDGEFYDAQSEIDGERADQESELIGSYSGAPTTLLAELQLRKEQQKQRNRTAATAFPNGMHSTLLELDSVAQIQKQARTKKHTHLAWEDPDAQGPDAPNDDDEDVPLGVLFPGRKPNVNGHRGGLDDDRPLGLIARRDMEDNEPLSHRRARLRGEPSIRQAPSPDRKGTMYTLDLPNFQNGGDQQAAAEEDEVEGETLAQRLKRLKAQKERPANNRTISGDFASEIMSQFGGLEGDQAKPTTNTNENNGKAAERKEGEVEEEEEEEEEETLAQRRARLQAEKEGKSRNFSGESNSRPAMTNKRRSMADILQAHPAAGAGSRVPSGGETKIPLPSSATPKTPWTMQVQQRALSGEHGVRPGVPPNHGYGSGGYKGVPNPMLLHGVAKDGVGEVRNKDMIDRWRQSVLY